MKGKSLSHVRLFATPWTAAHQAPPSMGFSRQEYWSGVPSPSPFQSELLSFFSIILARVPGVDLIIVHTCALFLIWEESTQSFTFKYVIGCMFFTDLFFFFYSVKERLLYFIESIFLNQKLILDFLRFFYTSMEGIIFLSLLKGGF